MWVVFSFVLCLYHLLPCLGANVTILTVHNCSLPYYFRQPCSVLRDDACSIYSSLGLHEFCIFNMYIQSLESSQKRRFSRKWKSKIVEKYFFRGKNWQAYFFPMKIKMMDLWMQIEGTKLIFVMNFSVLDFFKFASRMPQIAQILVSTFKIFQEGGRACPWTLPWNVLSFFH